MDFRVLVISAFTLLASCQSSKKTVSDKAPFSIIEATSESWTAGIKQGGSGVEYSFKLAVNNVEKLKFDSVWVNGQRLYVKVVKDNKIVSDHTQIASGDAITIRCSGKSNVEKNVAIPQELSENQALIRFFPNGKQEQYYKVTSITQLKSKPRQ